MKEIKNLKPDLKINEKMFTWGDEGLDNEIGKIGKGDLVLISSRIGSGQTTLATQIARSNKNSCYILLGDKVENVARRYGIKKSGITKEELNEGDIPHDKKEKFEEGFYEALGDVTWYESSYTSIEDILGTIESEIGNGCELFFIDHIGRVDAMYFDVCKKFCEKYGVTIVLLKKEHEERMGYKLFTDIIISQDPTKIKYKRCGALGEVYVVFKKGNILFDSRKFYGAR